MSAPILAVGQRWDAPGAVFCRHIVFVGADRVVWVGRTVKRIGTSRARFETWIAKTGATLQGPAEQEAADGRAR